MLSNGTSLQKPCSSLLLTGAFAFQSYLSWKHMLIFFPYKAVLRSLKWPEYETNKQSCPILYLKAESNWLLTETPSWFCSSTEFSHQLAHVSAHITSCLWSVSTLPLAEENDLQLLAFTEFTCFTIFLSTLFSSTGFFFLITWFFQWRKQYLIYCLSQTP